MTLQEIHRCDRCDSRIEVPRGGIEKIHRTNSWEENKDFELCVDCSCSLDEWLANPKAFDELANKIAKEDEAKEAIPT